MSGARSGQPVPKQPHRFLSSFHPLPHSCHFSFPHTGIVKADLMIENRKERTTAGSAVPLRDGGFCVVETAGGSWSASCHSSHTSHKTLTRLSNPVPCHSHSLGSTVATLTAVLVQQVTVPHTHQPRLPFLNQSFHIKAHHMTHTPP